ncbi:hypothetical protein DFH29DRAFT_872142 [Suillus ampliporus]|nr:hypothetical protein DFH29DRAFT_872142 [Suillus ampliporus]
MHFTDDVPGLFTDGVVWAVGDNSMIEKTQKRWFPLPRLAPPRGVPCTPSASGSISESQPVPPLTSSAPVPQPAPPPSMTAAAASSSTNVPPSDPPVDPNLLYNMKNTVHQRIVQVAKETVKKKVINSCVLASHEQKMVFVRQGLNEATSAIFQQEIALVWVSTNLSTMYKTVSEPATKILSAFGMTVNRLVQVMYNSRPSVFSDASEIQHKIDEVVCLMKPDTWLFLYGSVHKLPNGQDISYVFEHEAIINVVLDSIFLLGYGEYVDGPECLDNLMPVGAAAVLCHLQEFIEGSRQSISFTAAAYSTSYAAFLSLMTTIKATPHLLARWEMFCKLVLKRGRSIAEAQRLYCHKY